MSKSHLHRFICDDLLTLLFPKRYLSQDIHRLQRSPKTTSSASNTCCDKIKQKRKKKGHSFFVIGSLHHTLTQADTYQTLALYTYTHSCTHHFVKLHISKQVPLFISALTEPHTQIESTVTAYPYLLFLFFFLLENRQKNQITLPIVSSTVASFSTA